MYQNEKRVEVEKVSQNRMPFLSLTALEMQEKALFREGKKRINPMLSRCMQQRRLRLALTFSAVPEVRAQE